MCNVFKLILCIISNYAIVCGKINEKNPLSVTNVIAYRSNNSQCQFFCGIWNFRSDKGMGVEIKIVNNF